jgi:pimeloyl-ACP methyl ester carboxylesterase
VFWEYLRMPAVEQHLTMVYLEAMGTGASGRLATHPNGYTRRYYATIIGQLIDHLGQGNVYLLGYSYGGFVAQRYALDHPDRLTGLILFESSPVTGDEHGAEATRGVHAQCRQSRAAHRHHRAAVSRIDYRRRRAHRCPARLAACLLRRLLGTRGRICTSAGSSASYLHLESGCRTALPTLSTPTLVIAGRYDFICGVRWAEELHSLIPHSRLEILEKSGHFGHREEPEAFTLAITDFVAGTSDPDPTLRP